MLKRLVTKHEEQTLFFKKGIFHRTPNKAAGLTRRQPNA
jgi:hypothetical protein